MQAQAAVLGRAPLIAPFPFPAPAPAPHCWRQQRQQAHAHVRGQHGGPWQQQGCSEPCQPQVAARMRPCSPKASRRLWRPRPWLAMCRKQPPRAPMYRQPLLLCLRQRQHALARSMPYPRCHPIAGSCSVRTRRALSVQRQGPAAAAAAAPQRRCSQQSQSEARTRQHLQPSSMAERASERHGSSGPSHPPPPLQSAHDDDGDGDGDGLLCSCTPLWRCRRRGVVRMEHVARSAAQLGRGRSQVSAQRPPP